MQFKDVVGQGGVKARLVRSVDAGRMGHAQLFAGGDGSGGLSLAIAYAQYVNCTNRRDGDSCGVCASCRQIGQLAHPDLHFVFPVNTPKGRTSGDKPVSDQFLAEWRETVGRTGGYFDERHWYRAIGIDNKQGVISTFEADEIIRALSFKAFGSEYKIVLMWLPERMNVQAANKLLKILEEPWEKTLFLLVSVSPDKLLPTVLSRMQRVDIPALPESDVASWLTGQGVPAAEADRIARLSRGSLLEAARNREALLDGGDDEFFALFVQLMRFSYENRHMELLEWADGVASLGREEQKSLMADSIRLLRDSYMLTAGMNDISSLFGQEYEFCKRFAPYVNNDNIEQLVDEMERVVRQIGQNGNPRIIFPHFALTVSKLIDKV